MPPSEEYDKALKALEQQLQDFFGTLSQLHPKSKDYGEHVSDLSLEARDIRESICRIFDRNPIEKIGELTENEMLDEVEKYEMAKPGKYCSRDCFWWHCEKLCRAVEKAQKEQGKKPEVRSGGYKSSGNIAEEYGIRKNALRRRLERLRKKNKWDNKLYHEDETRGPREPQYYYNTEDERVKAIVKDML